jgi:hypothetical protein
MTHTPGPWHVCGAERGGCICGHVWDATGNVHVASATALNMVNPDDLESQEVCVHDVDETKANARLIAAAPDMLAALKAVVAIADRRTDEFDAARAAIAKAEGKQ